MTVRYAFSGVQIDFWCVIWCTPHALHPCSCAMLPYVKRFLFLFVSYAQIWFTARWGDKKSRVDRFNYGGIGGGLSFLFVGQGWWFSGALEGDFVAQRGKIGGKCNFLIERVVQPLRRALANGGRFEWYSERNYVTYTPRRWGEVESIRSVLGTPHWSALNTKFMTVFFPRTV